MASSRTAALAVLGESGVKAINNLGRSCLFVHHSDQLVVDPNRYRVSPLQPSFPTRCSLAPSPLPQHLCASRVRAARLAVRQPGDYHEEEDDPRPVPPGTDGVQHGERRRRHPGASAARRRRRRNTAPPRRAHQGRQGTRSAPAVAPSVTHLLLRFLQARASVAAEAEKKVVAKVCCAATVVAASVTDSHLRRPAPKPSPSSSRLAS